MAGAPGRVAWNMRQALRLAVGPAIFMAMAGAGLGALVAVQHAWLPFAAAGGMALVGLACFAAGARSSQEELPETVGRRAALLERLSTAEQFGHAFAISAIVIVAIGAGLALGGLLRL